MTESVSWTDAKCAHYEFSLDINVSTQRLWRGITDQIGSWWLPHFHMLGEASIIELEKWAGGRLVERDQDKELLWYTVIALDHEKSLDLSGFCTAKFGGPATTLLSLEIVPRSDQLSRLRVSDSLYGRVTAGFVDSLYKGWQELFSDGLKRYLESD